MDSWKRNSRIDRPLSGRAASLEAEADRRSAAVLLVRTLALGIMRKKYPHLLDPPFAPPSLSERREILNLLLRMTDSQTVNLAGRDHVIDLAIERGRS
jgi:hypothetical protein